MKRLRRMVFLLGVWLALTCSALGAVGPGKPNIIFILADDLGWGDTGFNWQNAHAEGLPRIKTPNLDRLAASGVTLTDHYCAAPVCAPSRASILTGQRCGYTMLQKTHSSPATVRAIPTNNRVLPN